MSEYGCWEKVAGTDVSESGWPEKVAGIGVSEYDWRGKLAGICSVNFWLQDRQNMVSGKRWAPNSDVERLVPHRDLHKPYEKDEE
jgi:hypothetical protein